MSIKKMTKKVNARGFTLLEILLVVGIISILAGIVILAINPTKQLGDTRNAQRRSDVLTILNAVYQYSLDNDGALPDTLASTTASETCDATELDVMDLEEDLEIASSTYLVAMPIDPTAADRTEDSTESEYYIVKRASGRVTVCAPNSLGEGNIPLTPASGQIEVTR
jgi:prepilin-type N-terminal cleavage/methylation domain-containing protein